MSNILNQLQQLQLDFSSSKEEILQVWTNLTIQQQTVENRLLIKALLDNYYHSTLQYYPDSNQLLPAGFFDDNEEVGIDIQNIQLFSTPIDKILSNLKKIKNDIQLGHIEKKPFVILLNTGAYSPIHVGHIQMMEEAKEKLSSDYHIIGGYLSPSHDKYVSSKYKGSAAYHSDARISLCQEVVESSQWLMVDPWEARYNKNAINFTDVISRLKKYLKHYINIDIEIGYVFGSDNAAFTLAFINQGISICFERPGYELQYNLIKKDQNLNNNRHFFIKNKENIYSSKAIREGAIEFLPEKIKHLYFQYKNNNYPIYSNTYLIRDDSQLCTQFISDHRLNEQLENFKQQLIYSINHSFIGYSYMKVEFLNVDIQNKYLNSSIFDDANIINVDLWTYRKGQYSLGISRVFELSNGQIKSDTLISRPHLKKSNIVDFNQQFIDIPSGKYTLVDDDIASGRTIKMIMDKLGDNIQIEQLVPLSQYSFHQTLGFDISYNFHDIVDLRDFLIGSYHGGLVVNLPNGEIGRAPYVWPYISLDHRAKIPHIKQKEFNLHIWKINKEFYFNLEKMLHIKDMDQYFIQFCLSIGFKEDMLMTDFCDYHIKNFIN